ncbi:MAG: class I SAM-dependent methyltransferase [Lachnospiraceae bacterium]|nr:class I SAM-dependent methyltransferase [Lachnospiraceae bacterium]
MRLITTRDEDRPLAERIAEQYGFLLSADAPEGEPYLSVKDDTLYLTDGELSMCGDFNRILPRTQKGRLAGELLVKAAKRKAFGERATAVDATAGLGEDAFLLAAAGFEVRLYEFDPVIAALLSDALRRASLQEELQDIVSRMTLYHEDSINAMKKLNEKPDVVLLDPMFPERHKSALIKKKFQLLQQLERPCGEEEELFGAAVQAGPRRILVKRPVKGPLLAGRKPDYCLSGKAVRYDCYIFA